MRVAGILAADERALDVLINGGFEPLANPVMRLALANTVSLAQAIRIRGLEKTESDQIIQQLLTLGVAGRET